MRKSWAEGMGSALPGSWLQTSDLCLSIRACSSAVKSTRCGDLPLREPFPPEAGFHANRDHFCWTGPRSLCSSAPRHSRVFSLDGAADYGDRGGKPYFKPLGWLRYAVHVDHFHLYKDWCVAYHGTTSQNAVSILVHGLSRPGERGASVLHGQAGSQTRRTIYMTPSIE